MEWAVSEIKKIQTAARSGKPITKPRWPVLILRTPKVGFDFIGRIMQLPSLYLFGLSPFPNPPREFPEMGNCYCRFANVHKTLRISKRHIVHAVNFSHFRTLRKLLFLEYCY